MAKVKDLTGQKFGRLLVLNFTETKGSGYHAYFMCKCDCGETKEVRGSHLKNGIISCRCYSKEKSSIRLKAYASSPKHKGKNNPSWKGDDIVYSTIHCWLSQNYKKSVCNHCREDKKLDWALKKGFIHKKKRSHYLTLCRKCHIQYDKTR